MLLLTPFMIMMIIFTPMTYYHVEEIVWPDYPLKVEIGDKIIKTIVAVSRRWEPSNTDQCPYIFSPDYILKYSLGPENAPRNKEMLYTVYRNLLNRYSTSSVLIGLGIYGMILVLFTISIVLFLRSNRNREIISESMASARSPLIYELMNKTHMQLPVTTARYCNVERHQDLLSNATQDAIRIQTLNGVIYNALGSRQTQHTRLQHELNLSKSKINECEQQATDLQTDLVEINHRVRRSQEQDTAVQQRFDSLKAYLEQGFASVRTTSEELRTYVVAQPQGDEQTISYLQPEHIEQKRKYDNDPADKQQAHDKDIAKSQIRVQQLETQANAASAAREATQTPLELITDESQQRLETISSTNQHVAKLTANLQATELIAVSRIEEIKHLKENLVEKNKHIKDLENNCRDATEQLGRSYAKEAALQQELRTTTTHASQLSVKLNVALEMISQRDQALEEKERSLKESEETVLMAESKMETLREELLTSSNDCEALQKKFLELNSKAASDNEQKDNYLKSLKEIAQDEKEILEKMVAALERENNSLQMKARQLRSALNVAFSERQESLQDATLKADAQRLKLEGQLVEQDSQCVRLKEKVKRLEAALNASNESQKQQAIDFLIQNAATEKKNLQRKLSQSSVDNHKLESQIEELKSMADSTPSNVSNEQQKALEQLEKKYKAEITEMQKQLEARSTQVAKLERKISECETGARGSTVEEKERVIEQLKINFDIERSKLQRETGDVRFELYQLEKKLEAQGIYVEQLKRGETPTVAQSASHKGGNRQTTSQVKEAASPSKKPSSAIQPKKCKQFLPSKYATVALTECSGILSKQSQEVDTSEVARTRDAAASAPSLESRITLITATLQPQPRPAPIESRWASSSSSSSNPHLSTTSSVPGLQTFATRTQARSSHQSLAGSRSMMESRFASPSTIKDSGGRGRAEKGSDRGQ